MQSLLRLRPGLRVLQVIYQDPVTYPPTLNAARVLARAGAQVRCLGYRRELNAEVELPPSVRIRYVNARQAASLPALFKKVANVLALRREIAREIDRLRPDLVIAYDHGAGWGVLPFARRREFKTVLHLHDLLNVKVTRFASSDGWMWAEMARGIGRFDLVVVPEQQRADYLRDAWGLAAPVRVAANSPPRRRAERNELLRKELAIDDPSRPLAVIVGNMGLYEETVEGLAAAQRPWHLALIGCGHGPSMARVVERSRDLGIADRVHILPYTSYDTVTSWLPGCDVGLGFYPSSTSNVNWQTMGRASVKVQEYMAAGLPSLVCSKNTFATLAAETGALEVLENETAASIAAALDRLEPGSDRHSRLSGAAVDAHLGRYNCEAQLGPMFAELGLAAEAQRAR